MNMIYLWSIVVGGLLGGCLGLGQVDSPTKRYYSLNTMLTQVGQAQRSWPVILGVRSFTAATRYRDAMLYRTSDVAVQFYEYEHWVEPPEEMVSRFLMEMLRVSKLFQHVTSAEEVNPPAWVLSGDLLHFDEMRTNGTRHAEVSLALELRRLSDERLLWSQILTTTELLQSNTPEGLAQAMSRAVHALGLQLMEQLATARLL